MMCLLLLDVMAVTVQIYIYRLVLQGLGLGFTLNGIDSADSCR